ncbi:nucleotidyltransferase domain-containing protein [bacterium]|nr:nucleotidyltransferase domain-containing protein [bacterium]
MTIATSNLLEEIASTIVEAVSPQKIILFGSHARETASTQSDFDLLVIHTDEFIKQNSRRKVLGQLSRALAHLPSLVDLLLYSEEEVNRWRHTTNHVISRAFREGKVLYERP